MGKDENIMKKIKKGTIVRTVVLVFALGNQILTACGKNPLPFSNEEVGQAVSTTVTAVASLWAWWKNNSFTQAAITADEHLETLKQI